MKNKKLFLILTLILTIWVIGLFISEKVEATIYGTISGKVIGEDTGEGIEGVRVILYTLGGDQIASTETDRKGYFQFRMLKEGDYSLQFAPPAPYLMSPYRDKIRKERLLEGKVTVEKGQSVYIEKVLKVGGIISGYVYREDGKTPIEGVHVEAFPRDKFWVLPESSITDSNGKYTITGLKPLPNYIVKASQFESTCHFPILKTNIKVEANKTTEVNFIFNMQDPTRINGKILSAIDGNPLPSVDISIDKYFDDMKKFIWIHSIHPDIEGKFVIIGVEPGIYKITAEAYNPEIKKGDRKEIEIHIEKGQTKEIAIFLDLPSK